METATAWTVESIVPEPRMPHNVNRDFTVTLAPGGTVNGVQSQHPAFANVQSFRVISSSPQRIVLQVGVHGMSAGTNNVPFTVRMQEGSAVFSIRVVE